MKRINIEIGEKEYLVEVAITSEEKEIGLQGRTKLGDSEGMLFDFSNEVGSISMWMKDTLIPLDIVFINSNKEVVNVQEGIPNTETQLTAENIAYVLEVNSGSGIQKGDKLDFIEDNEDDAPIMKVLAQDGSTQMDLWGGERIFSRKNTVVLIRKAKKANISKDDKDYKSLGRYIFKCIKGQDERPPEYVKSPKPSNQE